MEAEIKRRDNRRAVHVIILFFVSNIICVHLGFQIGKAVYERRIEFKHEQPALRVLPEPEVEDMRMQPEEKHIFITV